MGNRTAPTTNPHLWVLVNMLATLKGDSADSKSELELVFRVLKYVIAACHPKIQRRFKSRSSKEYLNCFNSVKPEDIHVQASSQRPRLRNELENDHNFLIILEARKIVPDYENSYPNTVANALKRPPDYATTSKFELFNDTTCKEYHSLFIYLVSQYQQLVDQIATLAKKRESFENILDLAVKTGHALLTMVKGRAFHLYLSTIASELSSFLPKDSHIEPDRRNNEGRDNEERDNEERDNEERNNEECNNEERDNMGADLWEPVQADATTALWKPFKSWIMLILAQLEAANILCGFVRQSEVRQAQIDVKIVHAPLVSDQTIPLEELFQKKYIPAGPPADPKTNAKLLDFIKTAKTLKGQVELLEKLEENWDPIKGKDALQVLSEVKKQHQEDSDQGLDPANEAIYMLSAEIIKLLSQPKQDAIIPAKITVLKDLLKEKQHRYNLPISGRTIFKGALHCEAALASILDKTTRDGIQARIAKHKPGGKNSRDDALYNNLSELLAETKVGFNLFLRLIPIQFTMVGLHASHRGIETLLPSVPSLSCLFIGGWTRRRLCHVRFSQHHHELHLARMDPRISRGWHE